MASQRDGGIAWCDDTWNPVRGCSRVSPGCENCYAERVAARFSGPGQPYEGLAFMKLKTLGEDDDNARTVPRWTGKVRLVPEHLADPLRWRRPRRVFVNSMSDLFHEGLSNEEIAAVFGVMAAAPQHTFQVLTKRAARMRDWFRWISESIGHADEVDHCDEAAVATLSGHFDACHLNTAGRPWPLPNVWLGVSVEDQRRADDRIPILLETPAAVRFLSVEPLLGPVDLSRWLGVRDAGHGVQRWELSRSSDGEAVPMLDWVIVGGESGPGARPCDLAWVRSIVEQCRAAGVPAFVKQLGANVHDETPFGGRIGKSRKGSDPAEWPEDLRVQEFPS